MFKYSTRYDDSRRIVLVSEEVEGLNGEYTCATPKDVVRVCRDELQLHKMTEEYVYAFCVNTKMRLQGYFEISHGNLISSFMGTREIFQKALFAGAFSLILVHTHPSGDPKPSKLDLENTEQLIQAGVLMGVEIKDHIIIGEGKKYFSFRENGLF